MPNGGSHSLTHFAGVVNQCKLVVCSDSLALHFAIACKKRILAFFGPTSPTEIELYGLGAKVYPNMDCLVCYKKNCDKNPSCMDNLSVDVLFQAIKKEISR
jgi:ADP-heptose:LPS heptosyltransferase